MVTHGGTSVAGSFIPTLTMVDVATGWTECFPLLTRDGGLVVEGDAPGARAVPMAAAWRGFRQRQRLHERRRCTVVPHTKLEVTRSRAYKKNDQAFVEQKNGSVVRRLTGYGRLDGIETVALLAARFHVNFFQPSFKLKEKRREGAKVIKRYYPPAMPYVQALAHRRVPKSVKQRLRAQYHTLDPVALLAEIRSCQEELGQRINARGIKCARRRPTAILPVPTEVGDFAQTLGPTPLDQVDVASIEPRATHRKPKRRYKSRRLMPSKLDPHVARIERWVAAEPQLTALAIVGRLSEIAPETFGDKQHSIVQRLLRTLRCKLAETAIATIAHQSASVDTRPGPVDGAACDGHSAPPTGSPAVTAFKPAR
jgi:hypothetical protein